MRISLTWCIVTSNQSVTVSDGVFDNTNWFGITSKQWEFDGYCSIQNKNSVQILLIYQLYYLIAFITFTFYKSSLTNAIAILLHLHNVITNTCTSTCSSLQCQFIMQCAWIYYVQLICWHTCTLNIFISKCTMQWYTYSEIWITIGWSHMIKYYGEVCKM